MGDILLSQSVHAAWGGGGGGERQDNDQQQQQQQQQQQKEGWRKDIGEERREKPTIKGRRS